MASKLNTDLEEYCSTGPALPQDPSLRRLYGMGLLPIVPNVAVPNVLEEIERISKLPHLRGVIMGTQGLGNGLDDGIFSSLSHAVILDRLTAVICC